MASCSRIELQSSLQGGILDPICNRYLSIPSWQSEKTCKKFTRQVENVQKSQWNSILSRRDRRMEKGPVRNWNKLHVKFEWINYVSLMFSNDHPELLTITFQTLPDFQLANELQFFTYPYKFTNPFKLHQKTIENWCCTKNYWSE